MSDRTLPRANFISVVVPTHNRATRLPQCLTALLGLTLPDGVGCEVICVDNNSSDDTRLVVERHMATASPIQLRYVLEPRRGASQARNAGLLAAQGTIITMTDDDCVVDSGWLLSIWHEFNAAPEVGLLGGRVELYDANDLPITIRTSRERTAPTPELAFNTIPSCNIAIRRAVIDAIGDFDTDFGPGTAVHAGEDTDFVHRAAIAGFGILYSPDVLVYHAHGRRTPADRRNLERGYFKGRGAVYCKHILSMDRVVLRAAYWEIHKLLRDTALSLARRQSPREELWVLRLLCAGAFLHIATRLRRLVSAPFTRRNLQSSAYIPRKSASN